MTNEKVYFKPGETVILKQDIPNKPKMIVKSVDKVEISDNKERSNIPGKRERLTARDSETVFLGITCFWFTTSLELQIHRFNSKDLVKNE